MATTFFSDFSRRDFMKFGLAGAFGVSHSGWLGSLAKAAEQNPPRRSCILLWMNGGPSQTDTFDLKPGHKNGGPFKEIETAAPGVRISEHFSGLAKQMKDVAVIRSMTSKEGDHGRATYLLQTGYRQEGSINYPSLGSMVSKELGKPNHDLPNFVSVSPFRFGRGGGAGFLGPQYAPLTVTGNSDNPQTRANMSVENLAPPTGVGKKSMQNRFDLLGFLQSEFGSRFSVESAKAHQANYDRAMRMVKSQAKSAFKLEEEPAKLRDAYGRNRFGQGCMLARRLVERGVPFVEVSLARVGGNVSSWDTHSNNFDQVKLLSEVLDPAWSTLMEDLRIRGLLDSTLIVWMGEFGRTPKINERSGRDHFPVAWSTVLAGGGIEGGQFIGSSGKSGMKVEERKVEVADFFATICAALGIDHTEENISTIGRPISIVESGGEPVTELLAMKPA